MHRWLAISILLTGLLSLAAAPDPDPARPPVPAPAASPSHVSPNATLLLDIRGMHCDGCAKGIAAELKLLPGVTSADVSFRRRSASVTLNTNQVSVPTLLKTIRDAGYEARNPRPARTPRP